MRSSSGPGGGRRPDDVAAPSDRGERQQMWRALVGTLLTLLAVDFLTAPDTGWVEWVGLAGVLLLTLDAYWGWFRARRLRRRRGRIG